MRITHTLLAIFLLSYFDMQAQQDLTFSLYTFNSSILNPAHTGTFNRTEIYAMGRYLWIGVDGAPQSYSVNANIPFESKIGASVGIIMDAVGPTRRTITYADLGSHIDLNNNLKLSMGIRGKLTNYRVQLTRLDIIDNTDGNYDQDIIKNASVNVGAGFVLYNDRLYAGISMPSLMETTVDHSGRDQVIENRHYFGYFGYRIRVSNQIDLNPSVLLKHVENSPLDIDINLMAVINRITSISLIYSHNDGLGVSAFYDLRPTVRLGVAYEYPITQLNLGTQASVEVAMRYMVGPEKTRAISPVYFNY